MKKRRPIKIKHGAFNSKISLLFICVSLIIFTAFIFRPNQASSTSSREKITVVQDYDIILLPTPVRSILAGEKLASVPVVISKWPKNNLNDNYLENIADYKDYIVAQALPANIPIPLSALSKSSSNQLIDLQIPNGMRAITVQLDSESALNGLVQTGSFVDVILIKKSSSKNELLESKVIAENVNVISLSKSENNNRAHNLVSHICTLLVSQEDALKIKTATQIGQITFMLRGSDDQSPLESYGLKPNALSDSDEAQIGSRHKGIFRSPDGKVYYLTEDGRWLKKVDNKPLREEQMDRLMDDKKDDKAIIN